MMHEEILQVREALTSELKKAKDTVYEIKEQLSDLQDHLDGEHIKRALLTCPACD